MSYTNPDGSDPNSQLTQEYYLCRVRTVAIAPLIFGLIVAGILLLTWRMLDPSFPPKNTRVYGKGALVLFLITILPVWARVPVMLSFVGYFIRLAIHQIRHAFDDVPDFVIGPEGISGLDELGYCSIAWSDVAWIDVRPTAIRIYGPERKAHWLVRRIAGERIMFLYSRLFFKEPLSEVLAEIKYYRPDFFVRNR